MERGGCVYIMTNYNKTVLYVGVTSDLLNRIQEHKIEKYPDSFTAKYQLKNCVYYEAFFTIEEAIAREKQLKNWHRKWKIELIRKTNPELDDLAKNWFGES